MSLFEDRDLMHLPSVFIGGEYNWQTQIHSVQAESQKLRRLRQQWSSERPSHLTHPKANSSKN
ncbi:hypothetical protein PMG71_09995 [Roseofilum sp. BLCC_M154]|uniref:Uncharacterized protein n=1 Tax=Roseofilum acuticapitatum BLCC-M154 TaxID=3022444 RepID=A0ABT7AS72_9CYAN|nr:hypothetical protein [Roseofilum acuticapitatum]MDJ1169757.1 hypothetical protein [Roseofilum acuticapitatum BLCC-M154]